MPQQTITTTSAFGIELPHDYTTHDNPSDKLMILLPGRGYTAESPLMRYVGQMGYAHGYDTLHIRYGIHRTQVENWFMRIPDMNTDTVTAVADVLSEQYKRVCIVAKSLGTIITPQLLPKLNRVTVSALMLTPVQDAMSMIGDTRALGIIGTADPAYDPDAIKSTATATWQVYDGLNHSLEYSGDWAKSIAILPDILNHCEAFIQGVEN